MHLTDFTPSIRDLETLDANPRRALTTAISRSRSSSQRHRRPPSVRSIGRYLVSGATPTSASAATPSEGRQAAGERQVERSQSLRVQQKAAIDGASRLASRRGSGQSAVPPRRTQSLRQATERPAVLPRLPTSQEVPPKSPPKAAKEEPVAAKEEVKEPAEEKEEKEKREEKDAKEESAEKKVRKGLSSLFF